MKIRVKSDGTCYGTIIEDTETGKPVVGVYKIAFNLDGSNPDERGTLVLTLDDFEIELGGKLALEGGIEATIVDEHEPPLGARCN